MPPNKIMLIRHAEKPVVVPPSGIDEDGFEDKHSLTVRGWQRAGALVSFFTAPDSAEGVACPAVIYASGVGGESVVVDGDDVSKSLRPQETVTPTGTKLGIALDTSFFVSQENELVTDIRTRDGVVLVCWEHKHIPPIAAAFCTSAPQAWPHDRFDVVWILNRQADNTYIFSQINQCLLAGDESS